MTYRSMRASPTKWLTTLHSRLLRLRRRRPKASLALILSVSLLLSRLLPAPTPRATAARITDLQQPSPTDDVLSFAHAHARRKRMPVYLFYPGNTGQLNNQVVSLVSALCVARLANATLLTPYVFYGRESSADALAGAPRALAAWRAFRALCRRRGWGRLFRGAPEHALVGDYLDPALLARAQPALYIDDFLRSPAADALASAPAVRVRAREVVYFRRLLEKRRVPVLGPASTSTPSAGAPRAPSPRELDCEFDVGRLFAGRTAGANENFLFAQKLFRTHALNCSAVFPYWLHVRRFLQPRAEIRGMVDGGIALWGRVFAIHLRVFDGDAAKADPQRFAGMILGRFGDIIADCDRVYVAYSPSSAECAAIVRQLKVVFGSKKVITAAEHGRVNAREAVFNMPYVVPLIDMWMCVKSMYFVGNRDSSLSMNVLFWREALGLDRSREGGTLSFDYDLEDAKEASLSSR